MHSRFSSVLLGALALVAGCSHQQKPVSEPVPASQTDSRGRRFSVAPPEHPLVSEPDSTPADPRVDELALTFGEWPLELDASLTLPRGRSAARLPALLLVAGSGPQDRDETLQRAKPFRDLAFGLTERGIITLRYDKRTFTHPWLFDSRHSTVEEEVILDAVLAARALRARPEVDPNRLYVLGHSLGALLAPEIAQRGGGAAGLVLLAAPGRPVPELLLEQLRARGATAEDMANLTQRVRTLPQLAPGELVFGVPAHYWQDLAQRDELATARALGVPILYLRGERDRNVFAPDQAAWSHSLAGQVPLESVTLPGLNHLLLPASADLAHEVHVPTEVIERIATFITHAQAPLTNDTPDGAHLEYRADRK